MENKQEDYNPEVYAPEQMNCIENHIEKYFGNFDSVFHEKVSPDIHVDICIIEPSQERNYYTLVTMGMGAHLMNVPESVGENFGRAELLIKLPPDWELHNGDEEWYWPMRWLKIMARLPIEHNTWLGYGHTVPNGEPFADNTKLECMLLDLPITYGQESLICKLPGGEYVRFYQMTPIYDKEAEYKRNNGLDALLDLFGNDYPDVLDINRKNFALMDSPVQKNWAIPNDQIKNLLEDWNEPAGCIATDRILVDGCKVGYMYREQPEFDGDSGWRLTAGDESDEYMDDPDNSGLYHLNTLCNYDPEIIPFLHAEVGTAYLRDEDGNFYEEEYEPEEE